MTTTFDMVAKTFQGLEAVLADELRALGADDVAPGKRMVAFRGDLALLYKANMCCRTALRILKPFYSFDAGDADELYAKVKEYDWSTLMDVDKTFSIDTVTNSTEFKHSQFVTYRVKDAIVDWFRDHDENERRPSVRLEGADIMINVHIADHHVTLSLDSSGESLHRRGWRTAQTEAPINEVLAAGIILMTGWRGETPFIDPMCGSGTFAIEAAMIAAGINPGVYRKHFAFENWPDFNANLLEEIYNDDSGEREVTCPIIAADIQPRAIAIARDNAKSAGVERFITFETKSITTWETAPQPAGVLVTNPPYGKRIGADDMNALYRGIGSVLKRVFTGYHAWIIGYEDEYFHEIGLAPSQKIAVNNGGLECELREYLLFAGNKKTFRAEGGKLKDERRAERPERKPRFNDRNRRKDGKDSRTGKPSDKRRGDDRRKPLRDGAKPAAKFGGKRTERPQEKEQENGRKPFRMSATPQMPSIPADKEIVLNRPAWRTRKKRDENSENNDK